MTLLQTYREQTWASHWFSFGIAIGKVPGTNLWQRDSSLSNTLSHLPLLSRSPGNQWKEAPGFWLALLSHMSRFTAGSFCCIVLERTSTKPHSPHTIVNVQSSVYHHGHLNCVIGIIVATRPFQTTYLPILPFTAILYILQKSKRIWCHTFHAYFHLQLVYWRLIFLITTNTKYSCTN